MPDDDNLKEDLIEMKSCQRLQLLFNKLNLEDFQCAEMKAFPICYECYDSGTSFFNNLFL